jgi:hypothetical protein
MAGAKRRHDAMARALASVSEACGAGGEYHDARIFDAGTQQRPADIWQPIPGREGGLAIDLTIGARAVASAGAREEAKRAKFAAQLAAHPHVAFTPFGVDLNGEVGPAAWRLMALWARSAAAAATRSGAPAGDTQAMVAAMVARPFTRAVLGQVTAWLGRRVAHIGGG